MAEISPELVERMQRAIHAYVKSDSDLILSDRSIYAELCAISELLPQPVDPDLAWAREKAGRWLAVAMPEAIREINATGAEILAGKGDDNFWVKALVEAQTRGRELERQS